MHEDAVADVSRRGFLAVMLAGTFRMMFGVGEPPAREIGVPPTAVAEEVERVRKVCSTPDQWLKPMRTLMWSEMRDGEAKLMLWTPETPDELASADRFYAAATWRSWRTPDDLAALVKQSPTWMVRLMIAGGQCLFVMKGEAAEPGGDLGDVDFTPDVAEAAVLPGDRAAEIIAGLNAEWSIDPENYLYFEPVSPREPWRDHRLKLLAVG